MSKTILFYSKKCPNCIKLWKYLGSGKRLSEFVKICVDNNNKIPTMIKSVPCVYVKGRSPIYGQGIYMYINSATSNIPKGIPKGTPSSQLPKNSLNAPVDKRPEVSTSTNNLNGIKDFNPVEMSSAFSDSYSFIQSNPAAMNFCYEYIKSDSTSATPRVRKEAGGSGNDLNSKLEQLQAQRRIL